MAIPNKDIKKLYAKSAGRCNMCKKDIVEQNIQIGEMAHILAKNESGPRGNTNTINHINNYENLILLCPTCHRKIDKNHTDYSVDYLLNLKMKYEQYVASLMDTSKQREEDNQSIQLLMNYIPFTQLRGILESLPYSVSIKYTEPLDTYDNFIKGNPHLYPFNDSILTEKFDRFIDDLSELHDILSGSTSKNNDGSCELISQSMMINGEVKNLSQCFSNYTASDMNQNIYINKSYIREIALEFLINEVENQKRNLLSSYFILMEYLRSNYKSIELNSYSR